jgi:hypothetical protein
VTFLLDVNLCCALLHNILLVQSQEDVKHLLQVLLQERLYGEIVNDDTVSFEGPAMEGEA